MNIEEICERKQRELLDKYFGNLAHEAAAIRPETIGEYTKDLPLKIEEEYRRFLKELWPKYAPEDMKGRPLVLEEQRLSPL